MRNATFPILVFAVLSASCSNSAPPAPAKPAARQPTVIDAQLKALDKAKSVQNTVDQQKKAMDKAIDDGGG